jgi:hypothetical protein
VFGLLKPCTRPAQVFSARHPWLRICVGLESFLHLPVMTLQDGVRAAIGKFLR